MKITILEFMDDYGQWIFFNAYKQNNPKAVIEKYLAEHDIEGNIIKGETGYIVPEVCRAWNSELV